jgi:hypothetical protein
MNIVRWEPFREMVSLKNAMDRLFEDGLALRVKGQKLKVKMPITELHSLIAKLQETAEQSAL